MPSVLDQDFVSSTVPPTPPRDPYIISGSVESYNDNLVIPGTSIFLLSSAPARVTVVKQDGTYEFSGVANGSYHLQAYFLGQTYAPIGTNPVIIDNADAQFDFAVFAGVTISGYIRTSGSVGIANVQVALVGPLSATFTTASNGYWAVSNMIAGLYVVTPQLTGYTFTPTSRSITLLGGNLSGNDFTGTLT